MYVCMYVCIHTLLDLVQSAKWSPTFGKTNFLFHLEARAPPENVRVEVLSLKKGVIFVFVASAG